MNVEIGVVKYILEIIDLEIGEYFIDFDVGFLLFNVNLFEGDGFIFYIISLGQDVQMGDVIDVEVSIVFDINDFIVIFFVFNIIDIIVFISKVEEFLEMIFGVEIEVIWIGEDEGSGVVIYDIYVLENGSDFELWLDDIIEILVIYIGEIDKIYVFYSVVIDKVG